ncbi:DUF4173 domain-containing protein [Actinoplanes sp. NBRC 101535]|uniref:DUF4153 domain-containing protein n=1 Tax=Actinoplanes sp. NBRC 101535 TaxID=3032196 RepID=UPI0024A203AD|nr:DUF4173 domain-containing protein [Actinoplanes sp. NBRC 101535]GLY04953.1 hypothetical protein Acsp01_53320 [Actinoplanes sp. NBRC 101535]
MQAPLNGPWPLSTPWGRRWPGPGLPASATTVVALLVATIVVALSVPLDRPGIGWLVAVLAAVVALIVARLAPQAPAVAPLVSPAPAERPWDRYAWTTATVALLAVGAFRAAGWLFLLCLMTATLTTVLALTSGRSLRSMVATYLLIPAATLRGVGWLVRGAVLAQRRGRDGVPVRFVTTAVLSLVLLTVFGSLFVSADAAFARIFAAVIPDLNLPVVSRWIFVGLVTLPLLAGAAYLRAAPLALGELDAAESRKVGRLEWAVPLGLLVLLFGAFVTVQLTVLFGGAKHVVETDGLTYAEYARSGFWQLCTVTALTLAVLAGAARWASRETPADRTLLRAVTGALAVLTLVVVASAMHRMNVYTDMYGLTRLRLLVACCEAWAGLVLLMVLGAGVRLRAPWLPRVAIATGVLALLALAVANPDARIAANHVDRFQRTQQLDLAFLADLSPDAAPAFAEISDGYRRDCLLWAVGGQMADPDDWRGWNLGRVTARSLVAGDPPADPQKCAEEIYRY